jgi:hypothetical protein
MDRRVKRRSQRPQVPLGDQAASPFRLYEASRGEAWRAFNWRPNSGEILGRQGVQMAPPAGLGETLPGLAIGVWEARTPS